VGIVHRARRKLARALYNGEAPWGNDSRDDYNWATYRSDYERDLAEVSTYSTQKLSRGDFSIDNGCIVLRPDLKPLHPNHACLYETIGSLSPSSVIEVAATLTPIRRKVSSRSSSAA
jgi:hypothetical protein